MLKKPKLIAFDLDYTLWPFWVDTHVDPPFRKAKNGQVVDAQSRKVKYYKEVPSVLKQLHNEGYVLAVASRTGEIDGANQLLKLFDWEKYFTYKEIYPGSKTTHFQRIKTKSGIDFSEMLFFDDEHRNKIDLNTIGVLMILVDDGVTQELIRKGLENFSEQYGSK
ncbi:magnesium-dependent phosphatase 1-like isoform X2 [Homarus americanus]|uniref:Magnesium-dependent phosphatase 1 n=1 Tax=Homarus americanus TaxID=6706 RepID=A0A8J5MPZ4_HOMAM|nr:magnesium-dependent phosphatase 1-like isoform X2 [Homarus americanus]XP_042238797.1 magnesium-dependent phosphatase 1-like isoform X2 [Homarus americanus]KAG7159409.1 Magnesium-dependent phosphatase 1-like 1 [Homarus americanus]